MLTTLEADGPERGQILAGQRRDVDGAAMTVWAWQVVRCGASGPDLGRQQYLLPNRQQIEMQAGSRNGTR